MFDHDDDLREVYESRVRTGDPNCFERTVLYLALLEQLEASAADDEDKPAACNGRLLWR